LSKRKTSRRGPKQCTKKITQRSDQEIIAASHLENPLADSDLQTPLML
jgi:hypothetical protein